MDNISRIWIWPTKSCHRRFGIGEEKRGVWDMETNHRENRAHCVAARTYPVKHFIKNTCRWVNASAPNGHHVDPNIAILLLLLNGKASHQVISHTLSVVRSNGSRHVITSRPSLHPENLILWSLDGNRLFAILHSDRGFETGNPFGERWKGHSASNTISTQNPPLFHKSLASHSVSVNAEDVWLAPAMTSLRPFLAVDFLSQRGATSAALPVELASTSVVTSSPPMN
ncbi:hypothetical protein BDN67DRAFT_185659 [Paxillus ammoniavirescens]|nr:hypothetical protein BDN67DRAFT_185659 [Paxillus ammoniavirescens]